ncbi:cysteine-rich small domain-containing protein [Aristaeella hokkaidonensis]|uniref:Cysteine-rich small domain-containing protein n=1 Tax=Aristaeella hokkaidonensis TaxID=3046382 RepID=A0AC61N9U3_9FIRM|nr:cysteine-rich small domain-containing protein [Aristaeella hokkaidonensis]QUC67316.1 cysteine-rich small domain-containing protein [Aristaeella hokkaidonensis]SNT93351.1 Zn-finger-like domain-containing protein [Aristaeella hokkaidonensis]
MEKTPNSNSFFQNRECRYFPCHTGVPEEEFNCLFCYCPLYTLGRKCGGNYVYTDKNIKSCINCVFPHIRDNYGKVTARFNEIKEVVRMMDGENE